MTKKKFSQFSGNLAGFLAPSSRFQNLNLATLLIGFKISIKMVNQMLDENYPLFTHRTAKVRFTKLKNMLQDLQHTTSRADFA